MSPTAGRTCHGRNATWHGSGPRRRGAPTGRELALVDATIAILLALPDETREEGLRAIALGRLYCPPVVGRPSGRKAPWTFRRATMSPHAKLSTTKHLSRGIKAAGLASPLAARPRGIREAGAPPAALVAATCRRRRTLVTTPAASSDATMPADKLRCVCLHGYLQNGTTFYGRIGSVRKARAPRRQRIGPIGPARRSPHPVGLNSSSPVPPHPAGPQVAR